MQLKFVYLSYKAPNKSTLSNQILSFLYHITKSKTLGRFLMKHNIFILFLLLILPQISYAQNARPGWFVVQDRQEAVPTIEQPQNINKAELPPTKQHKKTKKYDYIEDENLPEIVPDSDQIRFASNNKDLRIAETWLKHEFNKNINQNIVISPLVLYTASALLANGITDDSLSEFSQLFSILHLNKTNQRIAEYLNIKKDNVFVNLSLWGKAFSERYQTLMKEELSAEIWGIQDTTEQINNWVSARTNGLIRDIAPNEKISNNNICVAGSAYFKDTLKSPFNANDTQETEFTNLDGSKSKISMMYQASEVEYYSDTTMQAVRLYYNSGNYITILLPREKIDFKQFVSGLRIHQIKPRFKQKAWVDLLLPKLSAEYATIKTNEYYKSLGINKIFTTENYDFAKMISYDNSYTVKDVYLKARIDLEDSTIDKEEEAKTPDEKIQFIANRPFVYIINNGDFIGTFVQGK